MCPTSISVSRKGLKMSDEISGLKMSDEISGLKLSDEISGSRTYNSTGMFDFEIKNYNITNKI